MPSAKPRGHKGGAHGGSKGVQREFEKLSVSKRDSPVRHPSRNRPIRPGQLAKQVQARHMGNRAQHTPAMGDNTMGFPKTAWQDKRPSANLNSHSGQTMPRDGSRDGHRSKPYFAPPGAIKPAAMAPPVDRQPKGSRGANAAAAHRPGGGLARAPLEVVTRAPQFVPFQTVRTFEQPPAQPRGPSPPPIQQELPPPAPFQNDEAERQALEMMNGDDASQDAWTQGSQDSSTPHYNCTPDDNNPIIAAKPPPPPSPKSHHRSSMSRYTGSSQDTSDSDDEELEQADPAHLTGSSANEGAEDMESVLEGAEGDGADPQSPVFQISSVSLASVNGGGGLHIPSSTPTPDGSRTAVEDESVTMGVTETTDVVLSAPPRNAGRPGTSRSVLTQTERKPARANDNEWCPHVASERQKRQGSKSMAGETHDQASEYEWLEVLGEGSSGEVTKVRKHIDGWVYAMKKSKKRLFTKSERECALQEVFVLVAIQSPFIVRYYHSFIQESHLHILMEFCEGESLNRLVAEQRPCCEHYLLCLLWDISRALVHLHDRPGRPMVHLDIKPENIFSVNSLSPYDDGGVQHEDTSAAIANMDAMVVANDSQQGSPAIGSFSWQDQKASSEAAASMARSPAYPKPQSAAAAAPPARLDPMEPRFKLGDCGLVRAADPREGDDVEEGDRRYLSREFLEGNYNTLPKADIFALGITLYELASGRPLPDGGERMQDLRNGKLEDLPAHMSNAFKGLIRAMMHPDPQERPPAERLAAMAERELVAKAAEAHGAEEPSDAFGRVPRKSGPFSPLESPLAPDGGGGGGLLPSPIGGGMAAGGASPAGGTLREQQLAQQAQDLHDELAQCKQQLKAARIQIAQLSGGRNGGDGSSALCGDDRSPELCSMRSGGGGGLSDDDVGGDGGHRGAVEAEERRQLDFAGADTASSPNTSFNSIADMSQEL